MADTALELDFNTWLDKLESVAGTSLNMEVGTCKHCGAKVYEHQWELNGFNDYCSEDCQAEHKGWV